MTVENPSCEQILARALAAACGPAWARARTLRLVGRAQAGGLSGPWEQWIDLSTARHSTRLALGPADAAPPPDAFDVPGQAFTDLTFVAGGTQARVAVEVANNHVFVPVALDGHALRFMLDTGGVNLVAAATAQRIGLASVGAMEARGPGERSAGSGFARVERLDVGGAVALERQLLRVVDLPGFDAVEGLQVDGVLGVELFKRLAVQIDYARRELLLSDPAAFVPPPSAESLRLTFFGHLPGVEGALDGVPGQFLHAPFVEAHGLAERYRPGAVTTIGWGVGGPAQGRLARGGRLALGSVHVDAPVLRLALAHDGPLAMPHVAGNIGGEILRRFVVVFDHSRRVVHLAPTPPAGRPFAADRAGLRINVHSQGAVVMAVMAGGPADQAGVRVDDVVVAVDARPAGEHGLAALRERLADSPAGERVAMTVRRGGETIEVALLLRDLV